jgi:hypothetical protein
VATGLTLVIFFMILFSADGALNAQVYGWNQLPEKGIGELSGGERVRISGNLESPDLVALDGKEVREDQDWVWEFDREPVGLSSADGSGTIRLDIADAKIYPGPHASHPAAHVKGTCYWRNDTVFAFGRVVPGPGGEPIFKTEALAPRNTLPYRSPVNLLVPVLGIFGIPFAIFCVWLEFLKRRNEKLFGDRAGLKTDIRIGEYEPRGAESSITNGVSRTYLALFLIPASTLALFSTALAGILIWRSDLWANAALMMFSILGTGICAGLTLVFGLHYVKSPTRIGLLTDGFQVWYPSGRVRGFGWVQLEELDDSGFAWIYDTAHPTVRLSFTDGRKSSFGNLSKKAYTELKAASEIGIPPVNRRHDANETLERF